MDNIVISGISFLTSIGEFEDKTVQKILSGESGIEIEPLYSELNLNSGKAASVRQFDSKAFDPSSSYMRLPKAFQYAIYVVDNVIADANLDIDRIGNNRIAIFLTTGLAAISAVEKFYLPIITKGVGKGSPLSFPNTTSSVGCGLISMRYKIKGKNLVLSSGGVSGMQAIELAKMGFENDEFDVAIIVSTDELTEAVFKAYYYTQMISHEKDKEADYCIPYSKGRNHRNTTILGEAAAAIVIEKEESVLRRSAEIKGYIKGIANGNNAYNRHENESNDYKGNVNTIKRCLQLSCLETCKIDAVIGAGNGNQILDSCEAKALLEIFQDKLPPVIAPSLIFGETDGASGMLNMICASIMLMKNKLITIKEETERQDQYFELNKEQKKGEVKDILVLSTSFYGDVSAIVLSRTGY